MASDALPVVRRIPLPMPSGPLVKVPTAYAAPVNVLARRVMFFPRTVLAALLVVTTVNENDSCANERHERATVAQCIVVE